MASNLGRGIVEILLDSTDLNRGLDRARRDTRESTEDMDRSTRNASQNMSRSFQSIGSSLSKYVTLPLLAAGGAAFKFANDLNRAMANVATLIPGQTERVEELKLAVQDLAIDSGSGSVEIAEGLYQVVSAFGDTADTAEILTTNIQASIAGLSTVTDAINLTSAVTKAYGDTSSEAVQRVSDLALLTVRLGQTDFPALAQSIGKVTPIANELGVQQEELFAVLATATGVTGNAARVNTQLRGAMSSLMVPTEAMADLYDQLGVEGGKALIEQRGLKGAMDTVVQAAEQAGVPLQKYIAGIEGQTLALALAGTLSEDYEGKLTAMGERVGTTTEAFDEQAYGINYAGARFDELTQSIAVLLQTLGDTLKIGLVPVINAFKTLNVFLIESLRVFQQAPRQIQMMGVGFGAVAIAAGPLILALGQILSVWPAVQRTLVRGLAVVRTAFLRLLGPIGLGITAFFLLKEAWKRDTQGLRTTTLYLVDEFNREFANIMDIFGAVAANWQEVTEFFKKSYNILSEMTQNAGTAMAFAWQIAVNTIKAVFISMFEFLESGMQRALQGVISKVNFLIRQINKLPGADLLPELDEDVELNYWDDQKEKITQRIDASALGFSTFRNLVSAGSADIKSEFDKLTTTIGGAVVAMDSLNREGSEVPETAEEITEEISELSPELQALLESLGLSTEGLEEYAAGASSAEESSEETAAEVRTVTDVMNELASAMSGAVEIGEAMDQVGEEFDVVGAQTRAANAALQELILGFDMTSASAQVQEVIALLQDLNAEATETWEQILARQQEIEAQFARKYIAQAEFLDDEAINQGITAVDRRLGELREQALAIANVDELNLSQLLELESLNESISLLERAREDLEENLAPDFGRIDLGAQFSETMVEPLERLRRELGLTQDEFQAAVDSGVINGFIRNFHRADRDIDAARESLDDFTNAMYRNAEAGREQSQAAIAAAQRAQEIAETRGAASRQGYGSLAGVVNEETQNSVMQGVMTLSSLEGATLASAESFRDATREANYLEQSLIQLAYYAEWSDPTPVEEYTTSLESLASMGREMSQTQREARDRQQELNDAVERSRRLSQGDRLSREREEQEAINEVMANYGDSLDTIAIKESMLGDEYDATAERAKLVESTIIDLRELGLEPEAEIVQRLISLWERLNGVISESERDEEIEDARSKIKDLESEIQGVFGIFDTSGATEQFLEFNKYIDELIEKLPEFEKELEAIRPTKLEHVLALIDEISKTDIGSGLGKIAAGLGNIILSGPGTKSTIAGIGAALDGLHLVLSSGSNTVKEYIQAVFDLAGVIAEAVTNIPGLGRVISTAGQIFTAVLGNMANGMQEVRDETEKLQDKLENIDVSRYVVTERISRGGLAGLFGSKKESFVEEATNIGLEYAQGIVGGIQAGLTGDLADFGKAIDKMIQEELINSFIMTPEMQDQIQEFVEMIRDAFEDGILTEKERLDIELKREEMERGVAEKREELKELYPDLYDDETEETGGKVTGGTRVTEFTAESRDILVDLLRPLAGISSVPNLLKEILMEIQTGVVVRNMVASSSGYTMNNPLPVYIVGGGSASQDVSIGDGFGGPPINIENLTVRSDAKNIGALMREIKKYVYFQGRG